MAIPSYEDLAALSGASAAEDKTQDQGQIVLRRQQVLQLRVRGRLTESAIGALIGVSQSTVARDLAWWREKWRRDFGTKPEFDPREEIGKSLAAFGEMEAAAWADYARLGQFMGEGEDDAKDTKDAKDAKEKEGQRISPVFTARQRMGCLRTAMEARQRAIVLLQESGLMDRQLGSVSFTGIGDANSIRERLRLAGVVTQEELVSDGEREWLGPEKAEDSADDE